MFSSPTIDNGPNSFCHIALSAQAWVRTQIKSKGSVRLTSTQKDQEIQKSLCRHEVDFSLTSIFVPELPAKGELIDSVFGHGIVCRTKTTIEGSVFDKQATPIHNLHRASESIYVKRS
jgi:hypothetical protein